MYRRYNSKDYERLIQELKDKEKAKNGKHSSRDEAKDHRLRPIAPTEAKSPGNDGNASCAGLRSLDPLYDASRINREGR